MQTNKTLKEKTETLEKRLLTCNNYQEILDAVADALENPIIFYDIAYIAWAYTKVEIDDPLWTEFTTTGTFSPDTVLFVQREFLDAYVKSNMVTLMKSDKLKYVRINGGIFNKNGVQFANILVMDFNRPFVDEDFEMVRIACELIAKKLETGIAVTRSRMYEETLVSNLIEGKQINRQLFSEEIKELNHGLKNVLYVAAVDIMNFDKTLTHIVYISEYIRRMYPSFKCFVYLNNIIILMSFPDTVQSFPKELKELYSFFKEYKIYAGISGNFSDPMSLQKHYKHALNALNYGMIVAEDEHILNYDIFSFELFVNSHIDKIEIAELCHPLVFKIMDYDSRHATEYAKTVYRYLVNGLNLKATAISLKLKTNEVSRLLKSISKQFDIDWKNGNLLFSLIRSIKLIKCFPERFSNFRKLKC